MTHLARDNPPPFQDDAALAAVWDALPSARIVGGAVRDTLLHRPVADIDMASPLTPEAASHALTAAGIRVVPTGISHGTVTAVIQGRGFEITTLRRDVETDGRHAVIAFTADWREDAARRDFTINAMSLARDGTVFDYFGGRADLFGGHLRFVGDPDRRIAEDYLRILRFFRFYARYARTEPDAATLTALRHGIPGLDRLSKERVWSEIRLLLAIPDPDAAIALMQRLGVWSAVLPEAEAGAALSGLPPDPILRLAVMLTGDGVALAERLRFSNDDRDRLHRLRATPPLPPQADDRTLRRILATHRRQDLIDRTWLDGAPDSLRERLAAIATPVLQVEGRDIVAAGIPPGPAVGRLLQELRAWWLEQGCVADRQTCLNELAQRAIQAKIMRER